MAMIKLDIESMFLPILRLANQRDAVPLKEALTELAPAYGVRPADAVSIDIFTSSAKVSRFQKRTFWACHYLEKAGLLTSSKDRICITDRGRAVLVDNPKTVDIPYLRRFPEFCEFLGNLGSDHLAVSISPQEREEGLEFAGEVIDRAFRQTQEAMSYYLQHADWENLIKRNLLKRNADPPGTDGVGSEDGGQSTEAASEESESREGRQQEKH